MPIGHGSKFTIERCAALIACMKTGAYAQTAALANGISEECLSRWRTEGRGEPEGRYGKFAADMDAAEAEGEIERVRRIETAGANGDWKADAWHLERRHGERWKPRTEQKVDLESEALERLANMLTAAKVKVTGE